MEESLSFIYRRRSVRHYQPDPIEHSVLRELLSAAMAAPSACAKDPWEFLILEERHLLNDVAAALPNGKMLAEAAVGIVICGDLNQTHANELSYLLQDCSAAIENILLAAAAVGLGSVWLGIHPRQERIDFLRDLFKLPESIIPVSVLALGYPAEDKPARTRFTERKLHWNRW